MAANNGSEDASPDEPLIIPPPAVRDEPLPPPPTPRYSTIGDRFFAQVVDGVVALGLFCFIGTLTASHSGGPTETALDLTTIPLVAVLIAVVVLMLVYFITAEALLGATLGKLTAEARVQRVSTGRLIGYEAALTRNGLRLIDGIGFYLIGGICAMLTPRRQRVGDLIARTVVVHRPTHGILRATGLLLAAAVLVGGVLGGLALRPTVEAAPGGPRIASAVVTDDPNGAISKASLPADTRKVYLNFTLADAPFNTSVKASWYAPGAFTGQGGVQGAFPLGETEIRTGGVQAGGTFTLDTPPNGWIAGDYRVDLSINGVLARTEHFRIEGPSSAPSPTASAPSGGFSTIPPVSTRGPATLTPALQFR